MTTLEQFVEFSEHFVVVKANNWSKFSFKPKPISRIVHFENIPYRPIINSRQAYGFGLQDFYPRDAMLARVIEIATCLSVCASVRHAPVLCQNEEC